ncbi:MAG: hypothetical protein SPL05_02840 [Eubacteriales bacterium]|nr:hypothetical protein [Eubacteriales bacterium]
MKTILKRLLCVVAVLLISVGMIGSTYAEATQSNQAQITAASKKRTKKKAPRRKIPKTYYVEGQKKLNFADKFVFKKSAVRKAFEPVGDTQVQIRLLDLHNTEDVTSTVHVRIYYRDKYNKKWVSGSHESLKVTKNKQTAAYLMNIPANRPFYVKIYKKNHTTVDTKGKIEINRLK